MATPHHVARRRDHRPLLLAPVALLAAAGLLLLAPGGAAAGGTLTGQLERDSGSGLNVRLQHTYDQRIEFLNLQLKQPGFRLGGSVLPPLGVSAQCSIGTVGFNGTRAIACTFGPPGYFPMNRRISLLGANTMPLYPDGGGATVNACLQPCTGPPSAIGPFDIPGPGDVSSNPKLSGNKKQKLGKNVKVKVSCEQSCEAEAEGRIVVTGIRPGLLASRRSAAAAARKQTSKLKRQTKQIGAGEKSTLKLGVRKKGRRTGKKALKGGGKVKAKVNVTVTGSAGDLSTGKRTIKLKR